MIVISNNRSDRWGRVVFAVLLVVVVIDETSLPFYLFPPAEVGIRTIKWSFPECIPALVLVPVSLACLFVSMWKRWWFEIVGWVLLFGLFIGYRFGRGYF